MWAERGSALPRMTRPDYWLAKFSKLRVDRVEATQAMRATPGVRRVPRPGAYTQGSAPPVRTAGVSGPGQPAVVMRLITYNSGVRLSFQTW